MHVFALDYRNWRLRIEVGPGDRLALFANDCLRKERMGAPDEVLYVWTNLELEWEEHHWLEVRLLAPAAVRLLPPAADSTGVGPAPRVLRVSVNGEPHMQVEVAPA